jgi:hypothetical protein
MLASEPPISLLMKVRKMDYIDYGMKLKVENSTTKTTWISNHLYQWRKENKLNKIDIVGFFFSKGKLEKAI